MQVNLTASVAKPKILIVDDKEKNLFSLNAILKTINADVDMAKSGREAIAKALRNEYAVILLDVQMPELDGFDTAKIIKANTSSSNIPIIFVTAFSINETNIMSGYDSGGIDYMCKPLNHSILESKIRAFLDMHIAQQKTELSNRILNSTNNELLEFARVVSHDLKEPLRGIFNYATLLDDSIADQVDSEDKEKITRIVKLSEDMRALITDLFQYTQLANSKESMAEVNVNVELGNILETLQSLIEEKHAKITVQPNMPKVVAQKSKLGEVFRNLITNALKYNDQAEPTVEIGCDQQGNYFVSDNGIGIPEKHQASIFQIFRRLHTKGKYGGGTGAGLSIVKKIIDMHQGKIWFESQEGKGTKFYLTFGNN